MELKRSNGLGWIVLLTALFLGAQVTAASSFSVESKNLVIEKTGQTISVLCDNDFKVYGFSLGLLFEPAKLRVTGIALAGDAAGAPWNNMEVLNTVEGLARINSTGEIMAGAVLDLDPHGDDTDHVIPIGTGHPLITLTLEVIATADTTALFDFTDTLRNPGNNALIKNILTTSGGTSVSPTQGDGTIGIVSWKPVIQSLASNSGWTGAEFNVVVSNLGVEPGLTIGLTVCGVALTSPDGFHLLGDGQTLVVLAPACGSLGWAPVVVTTPYGSDTEANGFNYIPPPPVITGIQGGSGHPGDVFQVTGENLGRPNLAVRVCSTDATFSLRGDGITIDVTAPECAVGWAVVEVCTDAGCDSEAQGFNYLAWDAPRILTLANNAGLEGAVFQITGENFGRPGLAVNVCGKAAVATLREDDITIDVTAPACAAAGWANVEVCTIDDCDSRPQGFEYYAPPSITSITPAEGLPGAAFQVVGQNFNRPGLTVKVCDKTAEATLRIDGVTIDVTAPECAFGATATVEVCTVAGCGTGTFSYITPTPEITEIRNNAGTAGAAFEVVGRYFAYPGLAVKVCGVDAVFVLSGDATTLTVTAPGCVEGWAAVEVCTNVGCDSEPNGFNYLSQGTEFIRGDANNDKDVDLSDAIAILSDLFLGNSAASPCRDSLDVDDNGAPEITDAINLLTFLYLGGTPPMPPYPDPGLDPSEDDLPGC
jgi:hypothetical protein